MENLQKRRQNYIERLKTLGDTVNEGNRQSPREIIKEGVRRTAKVNDDKSLDVLTDKALKGEHYVKQGDFDTYLFSIAESIEKVRCETTPMNEYFEWIENGADLMSRMTDGFVSDKDLKDKNEFIKESWQREAEILTCLALYEKSNNPMAKTRYNELYLKLQRLRQIRSALRTGTQSYSDEEVQKERLRNQKVVKVLKDMHHYDKLGEYQNAYVIQQLQDLHIDHLSDAEFVAGYSFYTRMLADQRRADLRAQGKMNLIDAYLRHPDEYWAMLKHKDDTKDMIRNRILLLSGRKRSSIAASLKKRMKKIRQRAFDVNSFKQLQDLKKHMDEMEY